MQMKGANLGEPEEASTSNGGQLILALRKLVKKEVEVMVVHTVERIIVPMMEDLIRKVVKEEILSAEQKLMICADRNLTPQIRTPMESISFQLMFLDEVSQFPVLTGKEIKPKEGCAMRLAIADNTGKFVKSGLAASVKVEILVLGVNDDDTERDWSTEDFNRMIIRENDKKKPHFTKNVYVDLRDGIGFLDNVKLGQDSTWMKSCRCRLGARVVDNSTGSMVKEAWTKPFMVQDGRSTLYKKPQFPSLRNEVWRLKNISKGGERCKRLLQENIFTVQDFLFLLSADPQRLQRIARLEKNGAGSKMWQATVDHARSCIIDDKRIRLYREFEFAAVFDAVGQLRGIIRDSHYVPLDNLSEIEKARAHKLILDAFENKKDITYIDDETCLVHKFPSLSNDIFAGKNSTVMEGTRGCDLTIYDYNDEDVPREAGTSSNDFGVHCSVYLNHPCNPSLAIPDDLFFFEPFCDNEDLHSILASFKNSISKTSRAESCSGLRRNACGIRLSVAATVTLWVFKLRRVTVRVRKRQRSQ